MAIDLEKIRKRIEQLNSNRSAGDNSSSILWRPKPGKYVIRTLPWAKMPDGEVYPERWFYYDIGPRGGLVAPDQFGQADPVKELRIKCFEDGRPEMRELGKKLFPRMKAYIPIVIRGHEAEGVKLWAVSKTVHSEMLNYYLDSSLNEAPLGIGDTEAGFDIDVEITATPGLMPGQTFTKAKTGIPRARKASKLSDDKEQAAKWLASIPNIDEMYPCPSYEEVKGHVDAWFASTRQAPVADAAPKAADSEKKPAAAKNMKPIDEVFDDLDTLNGES